MAAEFAVNFLRFMLMALWLLILGRVLLFHLADRVVTDGAVDARKMTFVGRLGGDLYHRVTTSS